MKEAFDVRDKPVTRVPELPTSYFMANREGPHVSLHEGPLVCE